MTGRLLSELVAAISGIERMYPPDDSGISEDPSITSIVYDSRQVEPGAAFFAIPGDHTDGHRYIAQAVADGAKAVFFQDRNADIDAIIQAGAPVVLYRCENTRFALSAAAAEFHFRPSEKLTVIGVTGTDGKSSTVSFLHQLLESMGIPAGFISTVAMQTGAEIEDNNLRQSTPEAPEIHKLLRVMVESGKQVAVVESTSHGLSEKTARLRDIRYDGALFTNLSHEHLEFHGSFDQYRSDKANLFRRLRTPSARGIKNRPDNGVKKPVASINLRDPSWGYMAETARAAGASVAAYAACGGPVGADPASPLVPGSLELQVRAEDCRVGADRSSFLLRIGDQSAQVDLPLPGSFNIDNVIACAGLLHGLFGFSAEDIARGISGLQGVKGRMLPLFHGQPFAALVDYAHTPGSFRSVFPAFRQSCPGRLIAVFGSAGERDVAKRPIQGQIASEYADILVITDEDPRLEDSMAIIDQIAGGAEESGHPCEIHRIPDRRTAIRRAFELAGKGDLVVMLGKGHEGSIITAEGKLPWDEEQVARELLEEMGYRRMSE
jgi:UDP-N-acetylmuramoyl-L-alanyl-D-glutamate--2,6-diaminopimelate ligase